jgi:hypothetical protein
MAFSRTWKLNEKPWNISFQQCFSSGSQGAEEVGADENMKQNGETLREREIKEYKTGSTQALKIIHSLCYVHSQTG